MNPGYQDVQKSSFEAFAIAPLNFSQGVERKGKNLIAISSKDKGAEL